MAANWPEHKKVCTRVEDGYVVVPLEGRGMGCLANRDFEPGEVILQDEPLLVTKDGEKVGEIFERFDFLTPEEQTTLLSLYDPGLYEVEGVEKEENKKLLRILWANSIQLCAAPEFGVKTRP